MSATTVLIIIAIGLLAGFASSMVGIGGGIIIVPALVFIVGMDQKMAQGTSLLMLALPVAAVGAYTYYQKGNISWQTSLLLAIPFMVGGYFGGKFVNNIDSNTVKKIFAVFMMIMAVKYFFEKPKQQPSGDPKSEISIPK